MQQNNTQYRLMNQTKLITKLLQKLQYAYKHVNLNVLCLVASYITTDTKQTKTKKTSARPFNEVRTSCIILNCKANVWSC